MKYKICVALLVYLFYATPGGIIDAAAVAWCEEHLPSIQTVDIGEGIHYLQEDNPHMIGEELAKWARSAGPRTKLRFPIPTVQDEQVVAARNRGKILSLLQQAVSRDLFSQALVPAVAVTKSYLADMLALILRAFPKKLGTSEKKVELAIILEAENLDDVLNAVIASQIHSAFYASPAKYFEYIEQTLSISIPEGRKAAYAEVKATRDIYVHNGGITNRLYLQKVGPLARAADGAPLPLDEQYFASAIASMKGVVQAVYQRLLAKYGKSRELAACTSQTLKPLYHR